MVADCQRWCVGVCGGGVLSVKSDHWDFERCRIHTLGWALCLLNCLGRSPSAVCMYLHGFVFGVVVVGDCVSGVACRVPVKSDDWEPKSFEFARVARGSADSMCLSRFCFWWLPVVGWRVWVYVGGVQSSSE